MHPAASQPHSRVPTQPPPPQGRTSAPAARVARVCREVDLLLERSARQYPGALPAFHPDRLRGFKPRPAQSALAGSFAGELALAAWSERRGTPAAGIEPAVGRTCAVAQDHARAVLVSEHLGEVILSAAERERLMTRALGILPAGYKELFRELLLVPEVVPGVFARLDEQHAARTPVALLAAVKAISRYYRPATGLAWGMLILAGIRSPEQLIEHAAGLDRLCLRVASGPAVTRAFERLDGAEGVRRRLAAGRLEPPDPDGAACFEDCLEILQAVRDRLWELKPRRVSTPFLLPQVLECYLGGETGAGNSLGLGLIDAVVLGRAGFDAGLLLVGDTLLLEVTAAGREVFWEIVRPAPLGFVADGSARRLSPAELFGLGWGSMAAVHFLHGRYDRAIRNYENVVAVRPESAEAWNNLGNCRLREREPARAVEDFQRAIELEPDCAEAHHSLGNARATLEQWPRAIEAYKRAVAIRPGYAEAYNNLGFAFQHAGSPEQAIAAYQAALAIRPDYVEAHFNLGSVALDLERYDDAVRHYREAVRLQPAFAQAWYNMGQAHYGKGRLDQAISCYRRAVEANPKHFGAWHNLGIAYRDKGKRDKAVEALERAIALNPNLMQ